MPVKELFQFFLHPINHTGRTGLFCLPIAIGRTMPVKELFQFFLHPINHTGRTGLFCLPIAIGRTMPVKDFSNFFCTQSITLWNRTIQPPDTNRENYARRKLKAIPCYRNSF